MMKKLIFWVGLSAMATSGMAADNTQQPEMMEGTVKIGEVMELPEATGDEKFCVVTFKNRAGMDIPYKFKWRKPNGEERHGWKDRVLKKGYCKWHSWPCHNMTQYYFERFMIKYRFTPKGGKQFKSHTLTSGHSPHQTCEDGPQWTFRKRKGSKKKVDISQTRK